MLMDNATMPPVQPNVPTSVPTNLSMARAEASLMAKANKQSSFAKTIAIVMLSLVAVTFIGLFIWILLKYNDVSDDVNGKITLAVAAAKAEQQVADEAEFAEREKNPYLNFAGPVDYGELSFKYPRTWSLYISSDAATGGNFKAYFNPVQVNPISNNTINALRVTVLDKAFESVVADYKKAMNKKDSNLTVETIEVGGAVANKYTGTIPNSILNGYIVVFKIRDKTAIIQTDSVLFKEDFDKLLETVQFNA